MSLRDQLRAVPTPAPMPHDADAIADSVRYLASDAAIASIEADIYWPKWDSPWWHMLLLHEAGETRRIPERAVMAMIAGLNRLKMTTFPIPFASAPPGIDHTRDISCHCAVGSMYQILAGCGVDVDRAVPWFVPWLPRYQMADGGLNCDDEAYLVTDECPSSMVGTIAGFEAMSRAPASPERTRFVERAAQFLVERRLVLGSATKQNAAERDSARDWPKPCFPRFYYYDVLRGLAALASWTASARRAIPRAAIAEVVDYLIATFPDGVIRLQRQSYAGCGTLARDATGTWVRAPATTFPLLEVTSVVGRACPYLTAQWTATRRTLAELDEAGLVT